MILTRLRVKRDRDREGWRLSVGTVSDGGDIVIEDTGQRKQFP
jgi:hypothetical protein